MVKVPVLKIHPVCIFLFLTSFRSLYIVINSVLKQKTSRGEVWLDSGFGPRILEGITKS